MNNNFNKFAFNDSMILDKIQEILEWKNIDELELTEEELKMIRFQLEENLSSEELNESSALVASSIEELDVLPNEDIKEYIMESNANHVIFNACMELDNNENIYKEQYWPLVKNLVKKHKAGDFNIETLETSSVVSKLATATLKAAKAGNLSSEDRKRLYKFIVGNILKTISNEGEDLTKEEEDYMIEWDYNNSDKCGW